MVNHRARARTSIEAHWALSPYESLVPADPWFVMLEDVLPIRLLGDAPSVIRAEALDAIEQMLTRRLVLDAIFEEPSACIEALARWSGGLVWDILMLARSAVHRADPHRVLVADVIEAGRSLGRRKLASMRPEDLPRAVEIHRNHRVEDTEQDRRMIARACVLAYGRESPWWDVHPSLLAEGSFLRALDDAAREGPGSRTRGKLHD